MSTIKFRALSPNALMEAYSGLNGGPVATRDLLAFHLREGNVRARAWHLWESDHNSSRAAWKNEPDRESFSRPAISSPSTDISKGMWWTSEDWLTDQQNWEFKRGRFFLTISVNPPRRLMMRGIQFHGADIRACFSPKSLDSKRRPGRTTETDQWRMFWHEIIRLIQNDRTDFGLLGTAEYASNAKLTDKILAALQTDDGNQLDSETAAISAGINKRLLFDLKPDTVEKEVKALRRRFRLARGSI